MSGQNSIDTNARVAFFTFTILGAWLFLQPVGAVAWDELDKKGVQEEYVAPLPEGAIARLGSAHFRAAGQMFWMKLSPDGRTLSMVNAAQTLRVWDARTGRLVTQILRFGRDRLDPQQHLALSHDEKTIAYMENGSIVLRDTKTHERIDWKPNLATKVHSEAMSFSDNDGAVIVALKDGPKAFSIETGKVDESVEIPAALKKDIPRTGTIRSSEVGLAVGEFWESHDYAPKKFRDADLLSITADESMVAVGSDQEGNRVHVFKVNRMDDDSFKVSEHLPDEGHRAGIKHLQFVKNDKRLLSTSIDNTGRIWTIGTLKPEIQIKKAYLASISNAGSRLAVMGLNSGPDLRVYDIGMSDDIQLLNSRDASGAMALSPDGTHLAYTSRNPPSLIIEQLSTGKIVRKIGTKSGYQYTMQFSEDGKLVAAGASHPKVWDVATGKLLVDAMTGYEHAFMLTPNGRELVTRPRNGAGLQVWSVETGKLVRSFETEGKLRSGAIMHDNRRLIAGCLDGKIRVWDIETGRLLTTLDAHRRYILTVSITADDTKFATGCIGSEILVWDARKIPKP